MKKLSVLFASLVLVFSMMLAVVPEANAQFGGNICPAATPENTESGEATIDFNPLCRLYGAADGLLNNIFTVVFIVVVIIALAFLIFGGIKWITSGGDKAGVEAARNMIVAALVGLVIAFLAYFIITIVLQLFGIDFAGGNFFAELNLFRGATDAVEAGTKVNGAFCANSSECISNNCVAEAGAKKCRP